MMDAATINSLLGVAESYQGVEALEKMLKDAARRPELFRAFLARDPDLSKDWFTDYFQQEHGDRAKFKQDFTPLGVASLAAQLMGDEGDRVGDLCAGTGGLSIQLWSRRRRAFFHCEEFSSRALPFLLFNLAIRNIRGEVWQGDTVNRRYTAVWKLSPGEAFSDLEQLPPDQGDRTPLDAVLLNPPYSLHWEPRSDERLEAYGIPPSQFADFVFVLHGLKLLGERGRLTAILPSGVLFRGKGEADIRRALLERHQLEGLVGLTGKMFLNTDIPVIVLVLRKGEPVSRLMIVNAEQEYEAHADQNLLTPAQVEHILKVYRGHHAVPRLAALADQEALEDNDYNLNIPRYVNTWQPPEQESLEKIVGDLIELEQQGAAVERQLVATMNTELEGFTQDEKTAIGKWLKFLKSNSPSSPSSSAPSGGRSTQPELF